jgi:hypothetical protein
MCRVFGLQFLHLLNGVMTGRVCSIDGVAGDVQDERGAVVVRIVYCFGENLRVDADCSVDDCYQLIGALMLMQL